MSVFSGFPAAVLAAAVAAIAGPAAAAPVCADRVIRLVIPQPAGGVGDVTGRLMAEKVSAALEQPIVVENKPGGSSTIGTAQVATAKPDGCTFVHMTTTAVVASAIRNDLPYQIERDFIPVAGVGSFPMALTVPATSKIKTFADLIAAAKSGDGLNYASGGTGSMGHLTALRLLKDIGGKGTHVPYKGNAPALQGLLAGDTHFMFPSTFEAMSLSQAGKVNVLALTSDTRLAALPNVPTVKELGHGDFTPRIWYVFLVPAGTSAEVVARYQDAFAKALADPSVQTALTSRGYTIEFKGSADAAAFLKAEAVRWKKVIQDNNITSLD